MRAGTCSRPIHRAEHDIISSGAPSPASNLRRACGRCDARRMFTDLVGDKSRGRPWMRCRDRADCDARQQARRGGAAA